MLKGNAFVTASNISTNTSFCQYTVTLPPGFGTTLLTISDVQMDESDYIQYFFQTGAGVSAGSVSVQQLMPWGGSGGTWVTSTTPNSATGAAFTLVATLGANATYNGSLSVSGSIFTPTFGIRLLTAGLTGGSITNAVLILSKR